MYRFFFRKSKMVFTLRNWSYSVLPAVTYLQKQNKQTNLNKKKQRGIRCQSIYFGLGFIKAD